MTPSFTNEIAFVTGSNRGIGNAIVRELLARDTAKVYAAARNPDTLASLVEEFPGRVVPIALDVTEPDQIARAAAAAADTTIVVNNAGYLGGQDLLGGEIASMRDEFEINYWGPLQITRAFAPILRANGGGTLANISSVAGLSNFPPIATYSDAKAAVHSLTVGTRFHLSAQGTTVIGIYPGPVDTAMAKDLPMDKASPATVAAKVVDAIADGTEDVFTDAFAENYRGPYESGPKVLEQRTTVMLSQPA